MEDIERLAIVNEAARAIDLGEHGELVRLAGARGIGQTHDFAPPRLGVQRAVLVDADKQFTGGSRCQTGRIIYLGRPGE